MNDADPIGSFARSQQGPRRTAIYIVVGVLVFVLAAACGVPAVANQLGPLVPLPLERRLGDAVNADVHRLLDYRPELNLPYCGAATGEEQGKTALASLVTKLEAPAALAFPLDIEVVRGLDDVNAVALPAGHVYLLEGVIEEAANVDELAGVIAHEMGHIAHRDATRTILQSSGLSFLFSVLPNDFLVARDLLLLSYARDRELAADRYSVELLVKVGANPRALNALLPRLGGPIEGIEMLSDHPNREDRMRVIEQLASAPSAARSLLEPVEWEALKRICSG